MDPKRRRRPRKRTSRIRKKRYTKKQVKQEWLLYIGILLAAIFFGIFLVLSFGKQETVTGDSMSPTITNGDVVLMNRITYTFFGPSRGDMIAFKPSGITSGNYSVRRVVGLPGDTVRIEDGNLYINEEQITEESIQISFPITFAGVASEPIVIPDREYFVIGENTTNSIDSRMVDFGMVRREDILGRPWFVIEGESRWFIR